MSNAPPGPRPGMGRRLKWSIVLTFAFVVAEAATGWLAHSLALVSDAGHNLADALALVVSWSAVRAARRPADRRRTFGYHRIGILAALFNAVSLVVLAVWICWEACVRLRHPAPVHGGPMIAVALVAIVLNGVISLWLRDEAKHDLNVRSAYLHMLGDAASAVGVVVAGLIVATTGETIADPVVSLLIGGLILASSWGILSEALNVLLEGTPRGLDMHDLENSVQAVPEVLNVHDLHVWTVASGIVACSCHIVVSERSVSSGQGVLRAVAELLRGRFGISHTTIQVEVEGCGPNELYCTMASDRPEHAHHHHHHHGH